MLPLVQVKDLSVSFDGQNAGGPAVNKVSFDIPRGKITALIGESGSGKSVTALAFMQLLPASATVKGEMLFSENGLETVDLLKLSPKAIRTIRGNTIAMIFQEPMTSLNPLHTCGAQVMESLLLHKKLSKEAAKARAIELFRKVELPEPEKMLKRYPHEISGGQKQRVMIAMAISCDPALLIADEPTTALDVRVQKNILELLKKIQKETGMSVLLITHDLLLVADVADETVVMYKGEIVEKGPSKQMLSSPEHMYTKALLACRPTANNKGYQLPVISEMMAGEISSKINTPVHAPGNIILEVQDLTVSFPVKKNLLGKVTESFHAVDGVSFSVKKNETIGIVGESGCGKTTLGRAILGLMKPAAGKIIFEGRDIATCTAAEMRLLRKDLQIVFQDPYGSLNPRLTIGEAIMEPMRVHDPSGNKNQRREKAAWLLEKVNMKTDSLTRYPHQFSGGQRQRICIARALSMDPDFLLFDESVSALDVSVQAQVLNLINQLKADYRFTAIFISHDLSVIRYISDRVIVMEKGRIIETGTSEDIFFHPKENYTKELLASVPGQNLLL
ncbi:MAG: ABC transporter ATP-binding protein [Ferruginibacter sp.]